MSKNMQEVFDKEGLILVSHLYFAYSSFLGRLATTDNYS